MTLTPYKYWTRDELYNHLERQCFDINANFLNDEIYKAVYDPNWNPVNDYDGCSVVQDIYHPYVPCFLHDYAWTVLGGGIEHDKLFIKRLRIFGMGKLKSKVWYIAVRIGWVFWYKWKNRAKAK